MLTIVIPVYEKSATVEKFINGNNEILSKHPIIVIDRNGGEKLEDFAMRYIKSDVGLHLARKNGISLVETKYTLNLDADTIIPIGYIGEAIKVINSNPLIIAVSIDYVKALGHLGFGVSIWKTKWLKKLYDWDGGIKGKCECIWMWSRIHQNRLLIGTVCMKAKKVDKK